VNLIVERSEEGDLVAASWIGDARRDAACAVCGFARRDLLLRNRIAPSGATADETVQQATVAVRQSASGDYLVRDRNGAQRYEQVLVGLEVDSQRFHQGGARIELDAARLGGCPAGVEPRVDAVASTLDARDVRREGRGVAYFAIDPRALPVGVTTLVHGASYEAGHGGTIAQHVVRLVQQIGVAADPRVRWSPTAASSADGGAGRAVPAPRPAAGIQIVPMVVARPAVLDVSGRWQSNRGLVYDIVQDGSKFRWTVASLGQTAEGSLAGTALAASWSDRNGRGSARGAVKATDAAHRATRIEGDNGVVCTRSERSSAGRAAPRTPPGAHPTAATGPPPTTATCRSSRSRRRRARPSCRRRRPGAAPRGRGANPPRRSSRPRRRPRRAR
jgi:hypothetical protein